MADITEKYKGHTPAPWHDGICTFGPNGQPIEVCTEQAVEYGNGNKEARANAKLIADSPMLLSQLNEAVELLREYNHTHTSDFSNCGYETCGDCTVCNTIKFLNSIEGGK